MVSKYFEKTVEPVSGYEDPRFVDLTDPDTGIAVIGFRDYPDHRYTEEELHNILLGNGHSYMDTQTLSDAHYAIKAFIRKQSPSSDAVETLTSPTL
ncbi:MAG: hypothetical protein DYH13_10200 [Alphaproteobacteria bacterium PRO2]|nr:hypothetical protein [Alphaproteobacteria bacterium PRO2]